MFDAAPTHQAAELRTHVLRLRTPSERAQRREAWPWGQPSWVSEPITPEQTLGAAGIDDARQAAYQRKMSALLAGRL